MLFGKKKEKKLSHSCACVGGSEEMVRPANAATCCEGEKTGICCIKVLGSGCKSCHALLEATKEAVADMGLDIEVAYVTDMQDIMEYGVMRMPALVVNEQVISMGKVLKARDVKSLLQKMTAG